MTGQATGDMVATGSCATIRTEKKGRTDFAIENTKGKRCHMYLEVLVVPELGANSLFGRGAGEGSSIPSRPIVPGSEKRQERIPGEPSYPSDVHFRNHTGRR